MLDFELSLELFEQSFGDFIQIASIAFGLLSLLCCILLLTDDFCLLGINTVTANLAHGLVYLLNNFVGFYLREGFALVHTTKQLCKVVVHTHKQ